MSSNAPEQMPGYKALPPFLTGEAADQAREAEARHRTGDSEAAVHLLEEALAASVSARSEYPGWLCGRLAALYRTLGRYDDEVLLLERYRDSQTSEEARTRYDARLSKARTIAERKRPTQSGALDSVRASLGRPRSRRGRATSAAPSQPASVGVQELAELREAFGADAERHPHLMRAALNRLVTNGRATHAPMELLVSALKVANRADANLSGTSDARHDVEQGDGGGIAGGERASRYGAALVALLALYFEESAE